MTTIDEICAAVAADTRGYVGPAYRVSVVPGGVVAFTLRPPATLVEIQRSGKLGTTWAERALLYATCRYCGLGRPTTKLKPVDGCWFCPDEAPKETTR